MIEDRKIKDLEFACGVADKRVRDAVNNLAEYSALVEKLRRRFLSLPEDSDARAELQIEYEDALDEQHNLECYVDCIMKERNHLYDELKRAIDES